VFEIGQEREVLILSRFWAGYSRGKQKRWGAALGILGLRMQLGAKVRIMKTRVPCACKWRDRIKPINDVTIIFRINYWWLFKANINQQLEQNMFFSLIQ